MVSLVIVTLYFKSVVMYNMKMNLDVIQNQNYFPQNTKLY
jgi:hypothetical protein